MPMHLYVSGLDKNQSFKDEIMEAHIGRRADYMPTQFRKRQQTTFMKDEEADEFKHNRLIQSLSKKAVLQDVFGIFSRLIKSVEIVAYDTPGNVKHTTLEERLMRCRKLGLHNLMTSDYSSFEASHKSKIIEAVFRPFFNHVFQALPKREEYVDAIIHMLKADRIYEFGKKNDIDKFLAAFGIVPIEQSGDPTTALCNLILNMIAYLDVYGSKGVPIEKAVELLLLEGDDDVNDPLDLKFTKQDFAKRGLIAKNVPGLDLESAGLCQMFFHPEVDVVCPNPIKKMTSAFKVPMQYVDASSKTHRSLLRMQAMSLLAMHARAPITHAMARAMMRITSGTNVRKDHWKHAGYHVLVESAKAVKWRELQDLEVDPRSRLMVERVFGVSVEMQFYLEGLFDAWEGGPLTVPLELFPRAWRDYHDDYSQDYGLPPRLAEPQTETAVRFQAWVETHMTSEEEYIEYKRHGDPLASE